MNEDTRCPCCHQAARLNRRGYCADCAVCQHCDRRPAVLVEDDGTQQLGLCARCNLQPGFRRLYRRKSKDRAKWSPAREQRVRELTRRYQIALMRGEQ